ncbi:MAG TPA: thiamine phosphate synthase [Polaromonas sp.]|uniref:thiamine phosphate synthase n=1 Tax=Polaromonas sp. TaxID=1869339 RepID=UPI002D500A90|nr:thiamine phosphate synthase [Polaromonas sp.]HYW56378.1 thiamine phosphate synthase [Polaromonas sp.]
MNAPRQTEVWTTAANAAQLQALMKGQPLPPSAGRVLLCLSGEEASKLLGVPTLDTRDAIELGASVLQARSGQELVILSDEEMYAHTRQAQGWLDARGPVSPVFLAAAEAALASGFVAMEAIVLGCMANSHALHHGDPRDHKVSRPDFAQQIRNLPHFSLPQPTTVSGFAPLSDADLGLYAVVDSAAWVKRVVTAGVRTVQLRIKDSGHPEQSELIRHQVRQSIAAATAAGAQLFINDHWQIAVEEGAYGVHLGQEDLHVADLSAIKKAGLRLGISTHAYWEVCRAWALRPSYIACGPIHPTQAKAMPWIPQGNDNLAYWCKLLPTPVVGIAGMDALRTEQAAQCGAAGVAVISAITAAASPEAAVAQLQQAIHDGRRLPRVEAPLLPKSTLSPTV